MKNLVVLLAFFIFTFSCATKKEKPTQPAKGSTPAEVISGGGVNPPWPLPPIISAPHPGVPTPVVTPLPNATQEPVVTPLPQPATEPTTEPIQVVKGDTELDTIGTVETPEEVIKLETAPNQNKSTFAVKSSLKYLADVAVVAECVIKNKDFLSEIAAHKQFDYTKLNSGNIATQLQNHYRPVVLTTYYKKWSGLKLSKTIAYRNVGSNVVYFNTYKNPRAMKYMLNTAIHEWLHVQGFGHGNNSSVGKGNSVPYGVGKMAEKYAARCNNTKTK